MQYSVVMLVSRNNDTMIRCVSRIKEQQPDQFLVFLDPKLANDRVAIMTLKNANAEIVIQTKRDPAYDKIDPFINIAHQMIDGLITARHKWVRWCDDDDLWRGNTRNLLQRFAREKVALIHGNKLMNGLQRNSKPMKTVDDAHWFIGSCNIYNRDLFKIIRKQMGRGKMIDNGRFWDWRTAYWAIRLGMKTVYVNEVLCDQRTEPNPVYSEQRKRWFGKWPTLVKRMNRNPPR